MGLKVQIINISGKVYQNHLKNFSATIYTCNNSPQIGYKLNSSNCELMAYTRVPEGMRNLT